MPIPPSVFRLYQDLDLDGIHVRRPQKFIFFCGGVFGENNLKPKSLRQYLLKTKEIEKNLPARIILAEAANQLYRDTEFGDLISFEEEIAVISSLVLVIAESAGSLAELGAFATSDQIRPSLSVIMRSDYFDQNSFVRYGPVEKLRIEDDRRVGSFPWRTNSSEHVILSSLRGHNRSILRFIKAQLDIKPEEFLYNSNDRYKLFLIILWILHLSRAISITEIEAYIEGLGINISRKDLKNKLFCLKIAGWANTYPYSNKIYWYPQVDIDPISRYSYKNGVAVRDTRRRKLDVIADIKRDLNIPSQVSRHIVRLTDGGL